MPADQQTIQQTAASTLHAADVFLIDRGSDSVTLACPASVVQSWVTQITTLGDLLYGGAAGAITRLAGQTSGNRKFLRQTGTGTVSAAPAWDTVTATDVGLGNVENTALSTWAGSTNLTTLGTITTGTWNGTAIANANLANSTITIQGSAVSLGGSALATNATPTFASLTLTATASITLGTASSLTGQVKLKNASNNNVLTLQAGATGSALTFTLPTADGIANNPLVTDASGNLSLSANVAGCRTINAQTGTTYTLALADANQMVTLSNASGITLTVPANGTIAFPTNTEIDLVQLGAGQVTVAAAGGVTINSYQSKLSIAGQYAGATLKKTGTNTWLLIGNLA
jgi:hypothetical protein